MANTIKHPQVTIRHDKLKNADGKLGVETAVPADAVKHHVKAGWKVVDKKEAAEAGVTAQGDSKKTTATS